MKSHTKKSFWRMVSVPLLIISSLVATPAAANENEARELYIQAEGALEAGQYSLAEQRAQRAAAILQTENSLLASIGMRAAFYRQEYIEAQKRAERFTALGPDKSLLDRFKPLLAEIELQGSAAREGERLFANLKRTNFEGLAPNDVVANSDQSFSTTGYMWINRQSFESLVRFDGSGRRLSSFRLPGEDINIYPTHDSGAVYFYRKKRQVIKLDQNGKVRWKKKLNGTPRARESMSTPDGGFFGVWMQRNKKNRATNTMRWHRLDAKGKTLWTGNHSFSAEVSSILLPRALTDVDGNTIGNTMMSVSAGGQRVGLMLRPDGSVSDQIVGNLPYIISPKAVASSTRGEAIHLTKHDVQLPGKKYPYSVLGVSRLLNDGSTTIIRNFEFSDDRLSMEPIAINHDGKGGFLALVQATNSQPTVEKNHRKQTHLIQLDADMNIVARKVIATDGQHPVDLTVNDRGEIAVIFHYQTGSGLSRVISTALYTTKIN